MRTDPDRDRGSMPMAILVSVFAMGMTAAFAPLVVNSVTNTQTVSERTESIEAATDGLDAAMAQLRAASTAVAGAADPAGVLTSLPPCDIIGTETAVAGTETPKGLRYRVKITYYGLPEDPADESTAKPMSCPPTEVPTRAVLTVTGTGSTKAALAAGAADTRTVEATYRFKRSTENIAGGAIRLATATTGTLCMDSGDNPDVGTPVYLKVCKKGGSAKQRFSYTKQLNIKLMQSESADWPDGLCVDVPTPHKTNSGKPAFFAKCLGRQARQQWSLDNGSEFQGTTDGVNLDGYCLNASTAGAAGTILLGGCTGDGTRNVWRPEPSAGAGAAGVETGQLVNYRQFSRCLDVTNHTPTYPYMIVWFCKQAPDGNVSWNQQWAMPTPAISTDTAKAGQIRTAGSGNPGYCLRRPDIAGGLVTMVPCLTANDAKPAPELAWKVYGDTGNPLTSFSIVDNSGNYCLTATDLTVANPETHTDGTAKVRTALCSLNHLQKWNAPPGFDDPKRLTGTREN
ncbi:hypothetical protein AB0J80_17975 [Actinoplanes sp. NPDC049548]|uniref:hypothetical protein n=1 Tax=Actinoplanes sp. NPDC049548 TaxID=3155152 RepID=UPI0034254CA7